MSAYLQLLEIFMHKKNSKPNPNPTFITLKKESKKSLFIKKNGKKQPKIVFLIVKSSFVSLKLF